MRLKAYNEEIVVCFDKWPMIPTFAEIEAKSEVMLNKYLKLLGIEDAIDSDHNDIYRKNGLNLSQYKELILTSKEKLEFQEYVKQWEGSIEK